MLYHRRRCSQLQVLISAARLEAERITKGTFGCNVHHCFTVLLVHPIGVLICKIGQHLIFHVERARVRSWLHVLYDNSCANDRKVAVVRADKGMVVRVPLECFSYIVCAAAKPGNTHSSKASSHGEDYRE